MRCDRPSANWKKVNRSSRGLQGCRVVAPPPWCPPLLNSLSSTSPYFMERRAHEHIAAFPCVSLCVVSSFLSSPCISSIGCVHAPFNIPRRSREGPPDASEAQHLTQPSKRESRRGARTCTLGLRRSPSKIRDTLYNPYTPWDCHICRPIDPPKTTPGLIGIYDSPMERLGNELTWRQTVDGMAPRVRKTMKFRIPNRGFSLTPLRRMRPSRSIHPRRQVEKKPSF